MVLLQIFVDYSGDIDKLLINGGNINFFNGQLIKAQNSKFESQCLNDAKMYLFLKNKHLLFI